MKKNAWTARAMMDGTVIIAPRLPQQKVGDISVGRKGDNYSAAKKSRSRRFLVDYDRYEDVTKMDQLTYVFFTSAGQL